MPVKELITDAIAGELDQDQRRALFRFVLVGLLGIHILFACGWIPGLDQFRFARADELDDVVEQVEKVENDVEGLRGEVRKVQNQLDIKDLELAQERICRATKAGNREAVRYAAERKTELIRSFRQHTGRTPYVPTCAELGINGDTP